MTKAICAFSDFWFEVRSLLDERRPGRANLNFLPADVGAHFAIQQGQILREELPALFEDFRDIPIAPAQTLPRKHRRVS